MSVKSKISKGVLEIEVGGLTAIKVRQAENQDVIRIEVRDYDVYDDRFWEVKTITIKKEMLVPLIRAIAITMKLDNHALSNITYLVTHDLNSYDHRVEQLGNKSHIV